jgi:hypothetical protein
VFEDSGQPGDARLGPFAVIGRRGSIPRDDGSPTRAVDMSLGADPADLGDQDIAASLRAIRQRLQDAMRAKARQASAPVVVLDSSAAPAGEEDASPFRIKKLNPIPMRPLPLAAAMDAQQRELQQTTIAHSPLLQPLGQQPQLGQQQPALASSASLPDIRLGGAGPALAAALLSGPSNLDRASLLGETLHGRRFGHSQPRSMTRPPPPPLLAHVDRSSPSLILLPGTSVPVPADSVTGGQPQPLPTRLMQGQP